MLTSALLYSGVSAASNAGLGIVSGTAPDLTPLARSALLTLPLCTGVSGVEAAASLACAQAGMDILSGATPDVTAIGQSSLSMLGVAQAESVAAKTFVGTFTSILWGLGAGYVPEALSLLQNVGARLPWFFVSFPTIDPLICQPLLLPQQDMPQWEKEVTPAVYVVEEAVSDMPGDPYITDAAPETADPDTSSAEPAIGSGPAVMAGAEVAVQDMPECFSPYIDDILARMTPDIASQLEQSDELIVTETVVQDVREVQNEEGRPVLRYTLSQKVYDADILREDHAASLLQRLKAGETISWDHLVLAALSLLHALTPERFQDIVEKWTLESTAATTRLCHVDVEVNTYVHSSQPDRVAETSHIKVSDGYLGRELDVDMRQVEELTLRRESTTTVHGFHITMEDVRFGDKVVAGETYTTSIAEQELSIQQDHATYQEIVADGETRSLRGPEQHQCKEIRQRMVFEADQDMRPLAEQETILPQHLNDDPRIRLADFDEEEAPLREWETDIRTIGNAEALKPLLEDMQQGQFSPEKIRELAVQWKGVPAANTREKENPLSKETLLLENSTKEGFWANEYTKKERHIETQTTEREQLQAAQTTVERYVTREDGEGIREIDRDPTQTWTYIQQDVIRGYVRKQQDITTTEKRTGWGKVGLGESRETGETEITQGGVQEVREFLVEGKDADAALADGHLSEAEIAALSARQISSSRHELETTNSVDESTAGREFIEGGIGYIPLLGTAASLATKSSFGYELSMGDYAWAAADVALCLVPGGVAAKGAQMALKTAAKAGVKQGLRYAATKAAPAIGRGMVQNAGREMLAPVTMIKEGLSASRNGLKVMQKTPLFSQLKRNTPTFKEVASYADKQASRVVRYTNKAKSQLKDTWHRLNNNEVSLKNLPSSLFKDMSVDNPTWRELVRERALANINKTVRGTRYITDRHGRCREVFSKKLSLRDAPRDSVAQQRIGRLGKQGDEGGHLMANRFGGEPGPENLVPQNFHLNRGEWKAMENSWERALRSGKDVTDVRIRPIYDGKSIRPYKIDVRYTVDGKAYSKTFYNAG